VDVLTVACTDAVTKALQSTIAELRDSEPITRSDKVPGQDANSEPSNVLTVASRAAAENFFRVSQEKLTQSLTALRLQFVSTIRKLADLARQERFESLRKAITSLKPDLQPDLQNEILIDLNANAVHVQNLAFRKARKHVKTEHIRYGPKAAFQALEVQIAKPVRRMRDDGFDDEDDHEGVADLGFMLRAPIAAIAVVPFVLGVAIWPLMTQSKKYHLDANVIGEGYKKNIVDPFLRDLRSEGQKSLRETMKRSAEVSRAAVVDTLQREDDRYAKERAAKNSPPPMELVAKLVAVHSNFVAAEAALNGLREHLNKFV